MPSCNDNRIPPAASSTQAMPHLPVLLIFAIAPLALVVLWHLLCLLLDLRLCDIAGLSSVSGDIVVHASSGSDNSTTFPTLVTDIVLGR
jgi:hypothetical protein